MRRRCEDPNPCLNRRAGLQLGVIGYDLVVLHLGLDPHHDGRQCSQWIGEQIETTASATHQPHHHGRHISRIPAATRL